jgi:hypothetical protein
VREKQRMLRLKINRVLVLAAIALGLALALGVRLSSSHKEGIWYSVPYLTSETEDSNEGEVAIGEDITRTGARSAADGVGGSFPFEDLDGGFDDEGAPSPPVSSGGTPTPPVKRDVLNDPTSDSDSKNGGGLRVSIPNAPSPVATSEFMGGTTSSRPLLFPTARGTATSTSQWAYGQARGYAMLYAMQAEARPVVEANIAALLSARIRDPFIGVLIDGTFGGDFAYLKTLITRLNADGRNLNLALYLANGPAQRRGGLGLSGVPFARFDPIDFRGAIRRTAEVRAQYTALAMQARSIFEFNLATNPNAKNFGVVMLEDNFDQESYRAALQLALDQLSGVAVILRNPCDTCDVAGSDRGTFGHPLEEHAPERFAQLSLGDAFTLDGAGFSYPSQTNRGVSSETLLELLRGAYVKELSYFGLWRHQWQGVPAQGSNPPPGERTYIPSTADEMEFEIQALRTGLPIEQSQDNSGGAVGGNSPVR